MNLALPLNFFTQLGCGFVLFTCLSRFLNFLGMVLMLGFCFKILHLGWRFKGTLRFLCNFGGMPRIRLCLENMIWEVSKPKVPSLDNGSDPNTNSVIKKSSNVAGEKVRDGLENGSEGKDESECEVGDVDEVFDVKTLRELIKLERKKANAAFAELDQERTAASSSADEAMSMILRLQNEKSSAEIEANQFRRMAEQRLEYDDEVIESLQWTITRHESHRSVLEEQLRVYREELYRYLEEDEIEQLEAGVNRGKSFENEAADSGIEQHETNVSRGKSFENEAVDSEIEQLEAEVSRDKNFENEAVHSGIEQLDAQVSRGKSFENEAVDSGKEQLEAEVNRDKSFENETVDSGLEQLEAEVNRDKSFGNKSVDSGIEQLEAQVSRDKSFENEVVDSGIEKLEANISRGRSFKNEAVDSVVSTSETRSQTL
ncbi:myosin-binding protein 3-like [Vicia villosa]|uniref:myosin-binding protein 3-like n=1 Tax=Vicia villosa TaxID=3911 RepID=UPI00273BAE44|nr:myosin-binding protein 3-like [Vicia villosa]